ncbi:response regulator transcription factor [Streptomyces sp. NPDC020681]|uniref:response regulator transcription factor n=1 Tax=Streptomyces sp. NPDC020681 TaxID=3365083 RepID=UPI00379FD1F0
MEPVTPHRVLVVDDDPTVAEVVTSYFQQAGLIVAGASDGYEALERVAKARPDLVVLDLMLPGGMDGIDVCKALRKLSPAPAVIILTARGEEEERVLGLEVGADDYVTKPFSPRELVLRAKSVLRRRGAEMSRPHLPELVVAGDLVVDLTARRATRNGVEIGLTYREFALLAFLMRHPGRALRRELLLQHVWGWEFGDLSTVTVHARRLRAKVEEDPGDPQLIQTVWGVGYRFEPPADVPAGRSSGSPVGLSTASSSGGR